MECESRFVMSQWSRVLDPTVPVVRPCCPVYSTGEDVRVYVLGKGRGLGQRARRASRGGHILYYYVVRITSIYTVYTVKHITE